MNEPVTMGSTASAIVKKLRQSSRDEDSEIHETPRALYQPYLTLRGQLKDQLVIELTSVFSTAELLINQLGLAPGLHLLLNHFVEYLEQESGRNMEQHQVITRNTFNN